MAKPGSSAIPHCGDNMKGGRGGKGGGLGEPKAMGKGYGGKKTPMPKKKKSM